MQMYVVQAQQLNPYIYAFNFSKCNSKLTCVSTIVAILYWLVQFILYHKLTWHFKSHNTSTDILHPDPNINYIE